MGAYLPIAEHGLIGDLHTVALVGTDGTIDWYCCPRFDSPSVFGAILDSERGGRYRLRPAVEGWTTKQLYFPDTNVLITRFLTPEGVDEVEDFMPVGQTRHGGHRQRLIRRVVAVRGRMHFELVCAPRFDYGRERHELERHGHGALFRAPSCTLALETETPIELRGGDVRASFALGPGESATFILEHVEGDYEPHGHNAEETRELFEGTVAHWRRWLGRSRYTGRWRETVQRSALTLKLLTYGPTGALVAAPTTSLPERLGGERSWDYRYAWIRDAAFSLYALLRLGFTEEAAAFMDWLTHRFRDGRPNQSGPLQIMYGIDGRSELPEEILDHLEGYRGSAPVRVGNAAASQLQLDIYGELIDSVYLYNAAGSARRPRPPSAARPRCAVTPRPAGPRARRCRLARSRAVDRSRSSARCRRRARRGPGRWRTTRPPGTRGRGAPGRARPPRRSHNPGAWRCAGARRAWPRARPSCRGPGPRRRASGAAGR
jgi:GH15 family glucan-1,4-alpha-glucosidase